MTALGSEARAPAADPQGPKLRILYRDGSGSIRFDEPVSCVEAALADGGGTLWVDIEDLADGSNGAIEPLLRDVFKFHPLAIEDALKETHVPRVDDWGEYLFVVFPTIDFDPQTDHLRLHELDIFLGHNFVVTYHKEPVTVLLELRRNIERDPANRLKHGADHLLYHILGLVVAEFLPAIEHLDDAIDVVQDEVFRQPGPRTVQSIFQVKRSALRLHRILAPQREVLNRLARDEYAPISPEHRVYFRDVYDHIVRIHDISESLRDLIAGALDTYLSAISNRTNEIMKTLTLVTVMVMPISFLTSFFGMNFFGETLAFKTHWPRALMFWGSFLIMGCTPLGMWIWARRQGWF